MSLAHWKRAEIIDSKVDFGICLCLVSANGLACLVFRTSTGAALCKCGSCVYTGQRRHWGRVTPICVGKLTIIGSDNGLSPGRCQAIIRTNAGILLIRTIGTNFSEILSEVHIFPFQIMHLKMSSGKWRPFWLDLNVLSPSSQVESHNDANYVVTFVVNCNLPLAVMLTAVFSVCKLPSMDSKYTC